MRLHAKEKPKASGWTGFNISVRNEVQVSPDVIGYLPTIDAPATDMATVYESSSAVAEDQEYAQVEEL